MGTLTIRRVDDEVKAKLRRRAAEHGRSMEAEARAILAAAVEPQPDEGDRDVLMDALAEFRRTTGGVELDIPPRAVGTGEHRVPDFS